MRRALPWLLCALALAAVVAPMAQGTAGAKDPRVAGLIAKVNGLQAKVGGLQTQVNDLKTVAGALTTRADCFKAQGVVLRGTAANEGYVYKRAADSTPQWLYSALDTPDSGEAPQAYFATVTASCVTASFGVRSAGMLGRAETRR